MIHEDLESKLDISYSVPEGIKESKVLLTEMDRFLDGLNLKVDFPAFARQKDGIPCTEAEWDRTAPYLLPQLRALIARYSKLGENAFYKYYLPVDTTVDKALETL